ncbi:MAG: hypothetical protein M5U26_19130 [Planctomycetota bacterium]|nr:hypothetical protein [Planctomycetota bacterium]
MLPFPQPLPNDAPPSRLAVLLETLLALAALVSCWALMIGAAGWWWWLLALACGAALAVLLVRKLLRARRLVPDHELPPSAQLPPGAPKGRKLSAPPPPGEAGPV